MARRKIAVLACVFASVFLLGCLSQKQMDEIDLLKEYKLPGSWKIQEIKKGLGESYLPSISKKLVAEFSFYNSEVICRVLVMAGYTKGNPSTISLKFYEKFSDSDYLLIDKENKARNDCYANCIEKTNCRDTCPMCASIKPCFTACGTECGSAVQKPTIETKKYSIYVDSPQYPNHQEYLERGEESGYEDCSHYSGELLSSIKKEVFGIEE